MHMQVLLAVDRLLRLAAKACPGGTVPARLLSACQLVLAPANDRTAPLATPASLIGQAELLMACVQCEWDDSAVASSAAGSEIDARTLAGAAYSCGRAAHTLAQLLPELPATAGGLHWASAVGTATVLAAVAVHICSQLARLLDRTELPAPER